MKVSIVRWVALYTKGQQGYLAQEKPSACVIDVGGEHISRDWGGRGVITSRTGGIPRNMSQDALGVLARAVDGN